jgi:hypothetical protein
LCEKELITSSFLSAIDESSLMIVLFSVMRFRMPIIAKIRGTTDNTPAASGIYTRLATAVVMAMMTRSKATATGRRM